MGQISQWGLAAMGAREGAMDELRASPRGTMSFQEVTGYQTKPWRVALCHACSVLTAGLLLLLFHWKPSLEVRVKCEPCALGQADWVIIRVSPRGAGAWGAGGCRLPPLGPCRQPQVCCRIASGSASPRVCGRRCWAKAGEGRADPSQPFEPKFTLPEAAGCAPEQLFQVPGLSSVLLRGGSTSDL